MNKEDMAKMPELNVADIKASLKASGELGLADSVANNRKKIKSKFNFSQAVEVQLPSKGKFYQDSDDEDLKRGIIRLTPMSLAEEEILTNSTNLKNGSMFRMVFDSCIENSYPAKRILSYDGVYLMYALRNLSYGDDYKFNITCGECNKEFEYNMKISDIDFKELEQEQDERVIDLPMSKYSVTMRLLRLGDEEEIVRQQKFFEKQDREVPETILNFYVRTLSVKDEKGNEISPNDWIEFFEAIPLKDKQIIQNSFKSAVNNPKVFITCPKCGNVMEMAIPFGEDFFRLS